MASKKTKKILIVNLFKILIMIKLKPYNNNIHARIYYKKKIDQLNKLMLADIYKKIIKEYKKNIIAIENIAQDANPVNEMKSIINELTKKWQKIYLTNANRFIINFINKVDNHNKLVVSSSIKEVLPTFKINMSNETRNILNIKKSVIEENINLIKNIPSDHMNRVSNIIFGGISRGTNLSDISDQLIKIAHIPEKKAKLIARDQLSKSTSVLNNARYLEYGFNKAMWRHSKGGKVPRPDHVKASGEIYDLSKGCLISGEYIHPGQLINCRCVCSVVIE